MRFLLCFLLLAASGRAAETARPNIVIIFMDDMGYADVSCFGAKGYKTPNIDRLAQEGSRFTNFHVAQPVCSASRAALLTGCYPNRIGIHGALFPKAKHGLSAQEVTIAELVKQKDYATCAIGKWHLGSLPPFMPTRHGFDEYYGLPYSNDMWPYHPELKPGTFENLVMYENERIVDPDVTAEDQTRLTTDYTTRAVSFIERNKDKPFFLYLAHSMVHVPLFVSDKFKGKSGLGLFADVMLEVDWSVGQVMETLKKNGLEKNTWVIFTSDNGPWLSYGEHAGSAAPFREGKGTNWEGGTRVSTIMRWPDHIPSGTSNDNMLMSIDLLPTIAAQIDGKLPDHPIDGKNVWPQLTAKLGVKHPHDFYAFYYENNQLQSISSADGRWKLQLPHGYRSLGDQPKAKDGTPVKYRQVKILKPELYDVITDPGETKDVAEAHADIVAQLQMHAETMRAELGDTLMKQTKGSGTREPGKVE